MAGFRVLVDSLYPGGFKTMTEIDKWLRKAYDKMFLIEEWHEVGDTNEPAFENSWANYGSGYSTAGFMKDPHGMVKLRGVVQSGSSGTVVFTLPAGYRPGATCIFAAVNVNGGGSSTVSVNTSGQVTVTASGASPRPAMCVANFRADS